MAAPAATRLLQVRRATVQASFWTRIGVERFRLYDRATRVLLADGEEMWIDAGWARHRCAIASGPLPVRGREAPAGPGIADFVRAAVTPAR